MTPKQTLWAHIRTRHAPGAKRDSIRADATFAAMGAWHASQHHRLHLSHIHAEDGLGHPAGIGPAPGRARPSGWWTGLGVLERDSFRVAGGRP